MAAIERPAVSPPVNSMIVKDVQASEEVQEKAFDDRGVVRPKELKTNQDWYTRKGCESMPGPETAMYVDTRPTTKKVDTVLSCS